MNKRNVKTHVVKQLRRAAKGAKLMASLMQQGDAEALHDLRVQARTISSVLQPFLELPHMKPLRRALEPIRSWVRRSNHVRDTEAQLELIAELMTEPYPEQIERHLTQMRYDLRRRRDALACSKRLDKLPRRILRLADAAEGCLGGLSSASLSAVVGYACEALMFELRKDCREGLQDPERWHQARLRIKQLRYLVEHYRDFLDERYPAFVDDTKRAQEGLGRLRDWQNLRAAMDKTPEMSDWLGQHADVEARLSRQASTSMSMLAGKLAGWE